MALKLPESVEECVYFTQRAINKGYVKCWVFKEKCPKCGKATMGKPRDKDGNIKIRAKEYVCPECGHTVQKQEYEETLTANVIYTCPYCEYKGEIQIPFKRRKFEGADSLVFQCEKCKAKIAITKKMKAAGSKDQDQE